MGTGYSVATLKERFAQAARGKENIGVVVGKPVVAEEPTTEEDDDEPLLVENKKRFVLFPIKYHEVCLPPPNCVLHGRFGKCTRKQKLLSGLPKKSIYRKIIMIGNTVLTMTNDSLFLMFSPFSRRQMASSTRISLRDLVMKSKFLKQDVSTVFKL